MMIDRESITRRNLPHWYRPDAAHFLTYRLKGSIPLKELQQWRNAREQAKRRPENQSAARREWLHDQFFRSYDSYLDHHPGLIDLTARSIAEMIRENLYFHNESLFHLMAYVVMNNHVHALLQPIGDEFGPRPAGYFGGDEVDDRRSPLTRICHSLKSYTAHQANRLLGRTGGFWQRESYDHWVRDEQELERIVAYIDQNAVRAGLCRLAHEYRWPSAFDIFQRTGREGGSLWLPDWGVT